MLAKKSLGQHWLNDEASLDAMLAAAEVSASDTVLEIGPGLGSLTTKLATKSKKVIAVEKDEALAADLAKTHQSNLYKVEPRTAPESNSHKNRLYKVQPCTGRGGGPSNLRVVCGDILQFDFRQLPANYKLVANIPYYLTSNLIRVLSESSNPPSKVALLVQREVAERLAAEAGQMSILAVTAQFYWDIELGRVVESGLFEPPPKVDSQIVKLARRENPLFNVNEKQFFRLVKVGFSQKRKTLVNSLSGGLAISKVQARELLNAADIEPSTRAQALSLEEWFDLYRSLNNR